MKNLKYTALTLLILVFSSLLTTGCGEDDPVTPPGGGSGWHPPINMTQGQIYVYCNDSLLPSGGHVWTGVRTTDIVQAQTTFNGKTCFPVTGTNFDTTTSQSSNQIYYVSYTESEGKFYQYGIGTLINPTQPPTWDVVGDFSVVRGTSYQISTINYTVTIPPYGAITFTGPLTGKIADSTTITTTGAPVHSVPCYRIELTAAVSGTIPPNIPISATIIIDYYIGYSAPTGVVRINLKPFSFTVAGVPNQAPQPGYDRRLHTHTP